MNSSFILRIRFLLVVCCLFALIIIGKLYDVQIVSGESYLKKADAQYVAPSISVFDRGSIFLETKTGTRVAAAIVKDGYTIVMNPKLLTDPENAYVAIS
ncbi:MAG: hypothetical protein AAB917_02885, partial [Patescibacteria group bacterium]